jgi:vacuolar iron transporter family protein
MTPPPARSGRPSLTRSLDGDRGRSYSVSMVDRALTPEELEVALAAEQLEITEYAIYAKLASVIRDPANAEVLRRIADDEMRHYRFWEKITGRGMKPKRFAVQWFVLISRLFGLTFGIKLLERGEEKAQKTYGKVLHLDPEVKTIIDEEDRHEHELIDMVEEEHLQYVGSVVLGLNDALVELTGALAGLTFALQNTRLIALAGLITGIAASMSMAASEYLSSRAEGGEAAERAGTSAIYTGVAYIITVALLVLPYLLISHYLVCLAATAAIAILIIFVFNYYISVAKDLDFRKRFFEMAGLSLGVAVVSFGIGFVVRIVLGVEV